MLARHGYQTLPDRPRISLLEKRYFDMVELKRLFQVNLYHMQVPRRYEKKSARGRCAPLTATRPSRPNVMGLRDLPPGQPPACRTCNCPGTQIHQVLNHPTQ